MQQQATSVAITTGLASVLNMMRVVGVISIPGMMTGQLLGSSGTSSQNNNAVTNAARYQMLILFLIATCTVP